MAASTRRSLSGLICGIVGVCGQVSNDGGAVQPWQQCGGIRQDGTSWGPSPCSAGYTCQNFGDPHYSQCWQPQPGDPKHATRQDPFHKDPLPQNDGASSPVVVGGELESASANNNGGQTTNDGGVVQPWQQCGGIRQDGTSWGPSPCTPGYTCKNFGDPHYSQCWQPQPGDPKHATRQDPFHKDPLPQKFSTASLGAVGGGLAGRFPAVAVAAAGVVGLSLASLAAMLRRRRSRRQAVVSAAPEE